MIHRTDYGIKILIVLLYCRTFDLFEKSRLCSLPVLSTKTFIMKSLSFLNTYSRKPEQLACLYNQILVVKRLCHIVTNFLVNFRRT